MLTGFFGGELFSCLPRVDHVIKSYKEPIYIVRVNKRGACEKERHNKCSRGQENQGKSFSPSLEVLEKCNLNKVLS